VNLKQIIRGTRGTDFKKELLRKEAQRPIWSKPEEKNKLRGPSLVKRGRKDSQRKTGHGKLHRGKVANEI